VEQWTSVIVSAAGFIGLIVGYFIGYRSGQVAGELSAMKSMRSHRNGSSRRSLRPAEHADDDAA
jgi:hypothetical protein